MSTNDGGPAFPIRVAQPFGDGYLAVGGMTLRDYFAAHATDADIKDMMNILFENNIPADGRSARFAHADAMLAAREVGR